MASSELKEPVDLHHSGYKDTRTYSQNRNHPSNEIARLNAQAASIASEIAACAEMATDIGSPMVTNATHAAFIQAQTTNAQDIA